MHLDSLTLTCPYVNKLLEMENIYINLEYALRFPYLYFPHKTAALAHLDDVGAPLEAARR